MSNKNIINFLAIYVYPGCIRNLTILVYACPVTSPMITYLHVSTFLIGLGNYFSVVVSIIILAKPFAKIASNYARIMKNFAVVVMTTIIWSFLLQLCRTL